MCLYFGRLRMGFVVTRIKPDLRRKFRTSPYKRSIKQSQLPSASVPSTKHPPLRYEVFLNPHRPRRCCHRLSHTRSCASPRLPVHYCDLPHWQTSVLYQELDIIMPSTDIYGRILGSVAPVGTVLTERGPMPCTCMC